MTKEQSPVEVRVTRRFAFPAERVFDAWLDPAMLGRFMFGPQLREEEIVRLTLDARVGGRFSFVVRRQGQEIDHVGRYLELDRPTRLAFTWAVAPNPEEASRVTIEIRALPGGCELELVHRMDPQWAEYAERTRQGWTTIVGAIEQALAG
jgi:uncharacterized protein YndB with AHSA1/START domain